MLFVLVEITGPILITVTLLQSMHGALLGELNPHSFGLNEKSTTRFRVVLFVLVEITGIEPVTSCMPCTLKRTPRKACVNGYDLALIRKILLKSVFLSNNQHSCMRTI